MQGGDDLGTDPFGAKERGLEREPGCHERELVAANASERPALGLRPIREGPRGRGNGLVAAVPPGLLVQEDEVVEVDEEQRCAGLAA